MSDLLCIDGGNPCGWAYFVDGEHERSGEVKANKDDPSFHYRLWLAFNSAVPTCVDYCVCEGIFVRRGKPGEPAKVNINNLITLGQRRGALLAAVSCGHLLEPNPATWMRGRSDARIEIEAKAISGKDKVGKHERDAIMMGVWAVGEIRMLEVRP